MKYFLVSILIFLTSNLCAQSDIGIGLVTINFDENTTLNFYAHPKDEKPTRTLQFFNDQSINSWSIQNLDKHAYWLKPEILWLDYSQLIFRCISNKDNWLEFKVNNKTEETLWLQRSELTTFQDWETYLKEMFGVARLRDNHQQIRTSPDEDSVEIKSSGEDCFQVKSMKGDWIEIFTPEYCDESHNNSMKKIESGWIKWREGNKLLIDYFTSS